MTERELLFQATKKDFRLEWFSGTGAGGQHRNKHQNCLRLIHIASGIMTTGQENRDRVSNQRSAFKKMVPLLMKHWMGERTRLRWPSNSETIRVYHEPDNRVQDHASGLQRQYSEVVGKRDLSEMIDARRDAMLTKDAA